MDKKLLPGISQEWFNESAPVRLRIQMRPYTFIEICRMYDMKERAMKKVLKPIQKKLIRKDRGYYLTVRQVEAIVKFVGPPYSLQENSR
jgi:hypothetical protein